MARCARERVLAEQSSARRAAELVELIEAARQPEQLTPDISALAAFNFAAMAA